VPIYEGPRAGVTPLMLAVALRDQELVDLYIEHGANPDRVVPSGFTEYSKERYGVQPGETVREMAKRVGITL